MKNTPATQATSSMNYFFLKTVTGEIHHSLINEELTGFIQVIAERYYTIDRDTRTEIIKEIKEGEYFKDVPLDQVEQSLNHAIEQIAGEKHPNVASLYTGWVETARKL